MRSFAVMLVALAVAVSATLAAPAAGAVPDGFRQSQSLTVRASKIAPGAVVYCTGSWATWDAFAFEQVQRNDVNGLTNVETREIALAPIACRPLENHLRGRRVTNRALGQAIHTFTHEALHAKGIRSEMTAECRSLRMLPSVARYRFGVKDAARRKALVAWARRGSFCNR